MFLLEFTFLNFFSKTALWSIVVNTLNTLGQSKPNMWIVVGSLYELKRYVNIYWNWMCVRFGMGTEIVLCWWLVYNVRVLSSLSKKLRFFGIGIYLAHSTMRPERSELRNEREIDEQQVGNNNNTPKRHLNVYFVETRIQIKRNSWVLCPLA